MAHKKLLGNATSITIQGVPYPATLLSDALVFNTQTLNFRNPTTFATTIDYKNIPHTISLASSIVAESPRVIIDGSTTQTLTSSSVSPKPLGTPLISPGSTTTTSHSTNSPTVAASSARIPSDTAALDSATAATTSGSSSATAKSQSSPSASPSIHHASSSNGVSKGAAAGIGVGCAIAGALIAALIAFALMRGRRKSRPSRSYPLQEKPAPLNGAATAKAPATGAFAKAESSLPLPLEDAAIAGEFSRLQTLIKNYAQSYYHTSPVTSKTPDLSPLGPNLSIPPATLAAMLSDPRARVIAIRYCLAWVIFSRLGLDSDASTSLLPPEVAGCARPMSADTASRSSNLSLAPWRALTHSLLSPTYPSGSTTPLNGASIQSAVSALDTILQPYADANRDSYERMTKLEEIIKRGAKFGWTLFGQVSCYEFDWDRRTRGDVGIYPALLQTVDEKGERLGGRGKVLEPGEATRLEGM